MFTILVLCLASLVARNNAAPGLLPHGGGGGGGYNYQQNNPQLLQQQTIATFAPQQHQNHIGSLGGGHGGLGGGLGGGSIGGLGGIGLGGGSIGGGSIGGGSIGGGSFGGGSFGGGSFGGGSLGGGSIGGGLIGGGIGHQQQQHVQQNLAPVITKDIFVHSAPEEPEEDLQQTIVNSQPPRKHYRIIFIKAPVQSSRAAAIHLAHAAQTEEKTVIYVLSKKTDASDIQAALQAAPAHQPSKPEVFFIKYKTQAEAQHAQQQIQAQYDSLGGTSQISDEGIAPVTSVIGALGGNNNGGQLNGGLSGGIGGLNLGGSGSSLSGLQIGGGGGGNGRYLPPAH